MVTYKGPAMPSSSSSGECLWDGAHKTTLHPHSQVNTRLHGSVMWKNHHWSVLASQSNPFPFCAAQRRGDLPVHAVRGAEPGLHSRTASASQDTLLSTSPGAASLENSLVSDPHLQDSWKGHPVWVAIVPQLLDQNHLQQQKN